MSAPLAVRWRLAAVAILLTVVAGCRTTRPIEPGRGWTERGEASWYGPGFHGRHTANGEVYDMHALTAAHKRLPFDTVVEVLNRDNGRRVRVRINDRGPFVRGRIIDLSRAAASEIGMLGPGVARVEIRVVEPGRPQAASRARPPGRTAWLVQVGAFQDGELAAAYLREVRRQVDGARIQRGDGWHRIVIGPYKRKEKAETLAGKLARRGFHAVLRPVPR